MAPNPSPLKNHPTTLFKTKEKGFDFVHLKCIEFLEEQVFVQLTCYSAVNMCYSSCNCLNVFHRQDEETPPLTHAVANYMVYFSKLTGVQQHAMIVDWMKYTKYCIPNKQAAHCVFIMPTCADCSDDNDIYDVEDINIIDVSILDPPRICSGAILTILGIGRRTWQLCQALSKGNINRFSRI